MKKLIFLAVIAAMAVPAMAAMTVEMNTTVGGSPYQATVKSGSDPVGTYNANETFNTFCVEGGDLVTRYFNPGSSYTATIDEYVYYGGQSYPLSNNPAVPDPEGHGDGVKLLSLTKKIYSAYLNDEFTGNNLFSGGQIQTAIWEAQNNDTGYDSATAAIFGLVDGGTDDVDYSYWGNVKVLNLWVGAAYTGTDNQSQMVRVAVPVPGAFLLSGIGVACVGWMKRRRAL